MSDWTDETMARLEQLARWVGMDRTDIRAALGEIEQGRKARVALQEALGSHNVENPWLGICAAVALLQMGRKDAEAKLAEVQKNAEAERSAKWARLDKAEAEVERLRSSIASYQAAAHNYVNEHAEVARLKRAENRLRNALEQIDRETRSASDVGLLRMGSIARAALRGER